MADNSLGAKVGVPVVLPTLGPWISFTPTLTGSSTGGTVSYSVQAGRYRQNGDSVQVQMGVTVNTVTSAPTGFLAVVPPAGLTPDATGNLYLGGGFFGDSSAGTNMPIRVEYVAGVLAILNDTATAVPTLAASDVVRLEYMVPVSQYVATAYTAYGAGLATSTKPGLAPLGTFGGESGVLDLQQRSTTPTSPTTSNEVKIYTKGTLYILMFNDGGTVRYKYLDMAGTGVTWVHTTVAP